MRFTKKQLKEIDAHAKGERLVSAIKLVRSLSGVGLKVALDFAKERRDGSNVSTIDGVVKTFDYKDDHYIWALQNKENGLLKKDSFENRWRTALYKTREIARLYSSLYPDYKVVKVTLEYHIES